MGGKRGRPTEYEPGYADQAKVACEEMGATDLQLAKLFGVVKSTINLWKKEHPEFSDSVQKGRDEWNTVNIEKSLASRAKGYQFTETVQELQTDPETGLQTMVVTKKIKKFIPPDTRAIQVWLHNRKSSRWKNEQSLKLSGDKENPVAITSEVSHAMSPESRALLDQLLGYPDKKEPKGGGSGNTDS